MKQLTYLCVLIISIIYLPGCMAAPYVVAAGVGAMQHEATKPKSEIDPEADESALQTRATQVKEIGGDYKMTFRAAMDVLQDMGFTIAETNLETGHLVGIKKISVTTTRSTSIITSEKSKSFIPQEATLTMEQWGKGLTRVRVNTDLGKTEGFTMNLSQADKVRYLQPDKFYEEFFANLDKAVFLRKEKI